MKFGIRNQILLLTGAPLIALLGCLGIVAHLTQQAHVIQIETIQSTRNFELLDDLRTHVLFAEAAATDYLIERNAAALATLRAAVPATNADLRALRAEVRAAGDPGDNRRFERLAPKTQTALAYLQRDVTTLPREPAPRSAMRNRILAVDDTAVSGFERAVAEWIQPNVGSATACDRTLKTRGGGRGWHWCCWRSPGLRSASG